MDIFTTTDSTVCEALRKDLPKYSARDRKETLRRGERFLRTFNAACPQ